MALQESIKNHHSKQSGENDHYYSLQSDAFAAIADWYHYGILELTFVPGFNPNPKWIARRLGIGVIEAKMAVERLLRMGLLKKTARGYEKVFKQITNDEIGLTTNRARKEYQRAVLRQALAAIDNTPQNEKDITSITMAIDPSKLSQAREKIKEFRRSLAALLEEGSQTQVYTLGIQLYPITINEGDKK